jgi:hypothetical protein
MQVKQGIMHGLTLDPASGLRRSPPPRSTVLSEAFWNRYDSTTLFYCAQYVASEERLSLYAPPLLNLRETALSARFVTAGRTLDAARLRQFEKFDRLDFNCAARPDTIEIEGQGGQGILPVVQADPEFFAGTNLVYTLSRNNDLTWLRDWMLWNHRRHGADAILLADNDSTAYSVDDLADCLASVPGYRRAAVVTVPFKYGPAYETATKAGDGEFLQTAVMNALWEVWMTGARAVLNADVDEIVTSHDGGSIFDAAVKARLGVVMCTGHWRYALPTSGTVRHADHHNLLAGDLPCPPKYCIRPNSLAGRRPLKVHGVKNFKRMPLVSRNDFFFYHCRNISTSWKYDRSGIASADLKADPATAADLATVFS